MNKLYLFLIYYVISIIIFNGVIFIFGGDFELVKSLLLPLVVVSIVFFFSGSHKKKRGR